MRLNVNQCWIKLSKIYSSDLHREDSSTQETEAAWEELKLHFNLARSKENCYKAELLFAMFSD